MKLLGITSTAILSLCLGISAPAYAQHEQQGERQDDQHQQGQRERDKSEQQHQRAQQPPQQDRSNQQQHTQQPQRHDQSNQQQHAQQQQQRHDQSNQQQHGQQQQWHDQSNQQQHAQQYRNQEGQRARQSAWQQHRSQHWDSDHRDWRQRGGYHGYRIPEDRYRGYFGQDHGFRIYGLPFLVVGGYPRFQYHGYWLSAVDPWPEYWGNDWYDNDDVYVTYADDGYYLYNRRYANVAIAISISR
jgi:hypothetical protein